VRLVTGEVAQVRENGATSGPGLLASYAYDALGRRTGVTRGNGVTTATAFDPVGRLASLSHDLANTSNSGDTILNCAFCSSQRARRDAPSRAYRYPPGRASRDAARQPATKYRADQRTRVTWSDGFFVDYVRRVTGEIVQVRENGATSGPGLLASYAYDALGRRTGVTRGNGATTATAFDPVGRLASLSHDLAGTGYDTATTFGYNPASQIAAATRSNDAYAWRGHWNRSVAETPNALNQLTAQGAVAQGVVALVHDARGNIVRVDTTGYAYTIDNLLRSTDTGIELFYDSVGRMTEYDTKVSRRFVYDGGQVAAERGSVIALGDPYGNRTRVSAVKGPRPNR
jgi:uncharacterized protein RhaS with RHS repeats